jgi:hypothetical protein
VKDALADSAMTLFKSMRGVADAQLPQVIELTDDTTQEEIK